MIELFLHLMFVKVCGFDLYSVFWIIACIDFYCLVYGFSLNL